MSRRPRPRRAQSRNWLLLAGIGAGGLLVGYLIGTTGRGPAPLVEPAPASAVEVAEASAVEAEYLGSTPANEPSGTTTLAAGESLTEGAPPMPTPSVLQEPVAVAEPVELGPIPEGGGARLALVIDDLGRRVADVVELSELGVPLSFAVLPFESRTSEVVEELARRDAEVMLHLPMQPRNGANPGPGALTSDMSAAELEAATRWALEAVAGATGVNNHMGSGLSANRETMRTVLRVLAERELFYLDSRTSADSVGYRTALELGLPTAERHVFLDAETRADAIRVQFRRLLDLARKRGSAVAIGHPHRVTLEVLVEEIPKARDAGYVFVPVSSLISSAPISAAR